MCTTIVDVRHKNQYRDNKMNIPLNEFEQYIDEDILKRGLQYFKKGYVIQVDEMANGRYQALVEGSETYEVNLTIRNGMIAESVCTCPYDWGPVCKHEVSVLFYLQQEELGIKAKRKPNQPTSLSEVNTSHKSSKPVQKKKTIGEQINEILEILPHQELKGFIGECCDKDPAFRNSFLTRYLYLIQPMSKEIYSKQIQSIVRSEAGRHGFLDYQAARRVGRQISELAQLAGREIEAGHFREAMYIGCAMLEEMTKAVENGDDSSGALGDGVSFALDILFKIAAGCTDKDIRRELFGFGIHSFEKEVFKGWDWHFGMLELAVGLMETPGDKSTLLKLLDSIESTGKSWDYNFEKAQGMRLEIIRKTESEENVNEYLEANIMNPEFRRELIDKTLSAKDYNKAIRLCENGIKTDEKDKPGLATRWRTMLLDIYQKQNDTDKITETARYLFLNGGDTYPSVYFGLLKKHVPGTEWNDFFERLVEDKKKTNRWMGFSPIADMYIWESRWEDLLSWLIQHITLDNVLYVEKYLATDYAMQLVAFYYNGVEKHVDQNVGRSHYKLACKFIRRMIKLGGRDEADFLITELRKRYPMRRALIEELDKI